MNKKVLNRLAVMLFIAALISSCKDQDAFVIKGQIDDPGKVKTVYLLAPDTALSYSMTTIDSAKVDDDHRFTFKHQAFFPTFYKLIIGHMTVDVITQNGEEISFRTQGGKDTTFKYDMSGSEGSLAMQKFNQMSNYYTGITNTLSNEYGAKTKAAKNKADSDALYTEYYPKFISNMDNFGVKAWAFVEEYKNSLAGYIASKTLDKYKYEQQLVAYADEIKDKFPGNKDVAMFVKSMAAIKPVSVGHAAPDFTITDMDGKPAKLSDYKGKYVMLDFWASWCAPCRQENPNVVKQYAKFKDKGLNILSISLDEDPKAWKEAAAHDKLTWRHAAEFKRFDGPTVKLYKVEAIPSNFIIDPKGVIVAKNITGPELETFLSKTFK